MPPIPLRQRVWILSLLLLAATVVFAVACGSGDTTIEERWEGLNVPEAEIVFLGDFTEAEQAAIAREVKSVQAAFAERFGVVTSEFTLYISTEYEALNEDFSGRGRRSEEQVAVLRAFWTQEHVTFEGEWHRIASAGLSPMPVQRPIPIWFGGGSTAAVVRRIARLGDGWFPLVRQGLTNEEALEEFRGYVREAGRDPAAIGIETQARMMAGVEEAVRQAREWEALGATHLGVNTMGAGYRTPDEHIEA